jgi:hypothetical protein
MSGIMSKAAKGVVPAGMAAAALADASRHSDHIWDTAGHSKKGWMAAITLLPVVGPLAYAVRIRPELDVSEEAVALQGG